MKEKIVAEGMRITVERKNIKHMYLRVLTPDCEIKINAPLHISENEIIQFVLSKKDWILKRQKLILDGKIKSPLKYKTGEKHKLWGEDYTIQLILKDKVKKTYADYDKKIIYLAVLKKSSCKTRKKALYEFYRSEMEREITPLLEECINIVGQKPNDVKIRKMKNWGNCRYNDRRVTFNLKLAMKDKICLKYVIIHELTHLIEFNHGKNFKKLMDEFLPNWREIKRKLNK